VRRSHDFGPGSSSGPSFLTLLTRVEARSWTSQVFGGGRNSQPSALAGVFASSHSSRYDFSEHDWRPIVNWCHQAVGWWWNVAAASGAEPR